MGLLTRNNLLSYKFTRTIQEADGSRKTYVIVKASGLRDTVNNRKKAAKLEEDHAAAIDTGRIHPKDTWPVAPAPQVAKPTFQAVADDMLVSARLRLKPRSVVFYETCLSRIKLYPKLSEAPIDAVTAGLVRSYVDWRLTSSKDDKKTPDSKATVNGEIRTVRAVLSFAMQRGLIGQAPRIAELDAGESHRQALTFEQEAIYLGAAQENPVLYDMAVLLIDSGLRPNSEAFGLKWSQIRPDGIVIEKSKSRAGRRIVPITARLKAVLDLRGEKSNESPYVFPAESGTGHLMTITKAHFKACDDAKLARFPVYTFRHTFASRCAQAGIDRHVLCGWMGHSSPSVTDSYYIHVSQEHQTTGFQKLETYLTAHKVDAARQVTQRLQ